MVSRVIFLRNVEIVRIHSMSVEPNFSSTTPIVFYGQNYPILAMEMETCLKALILWEAVEDDYEISPMPTNPTINHIKNHKDKNEKIKKQRLAYLL